MQQHQFLISLLSKSKKNEPIIEHIKQTILRYGLDDGALDAALAIYPKTGPKTIERSTKKRATVSLCMITKNEEEHLPRCLLSVDPIVDEIIVVDTGSTDRTRDVAKAFGARVEEFAWTEDFAAARNVSLEKASGDWIFVMDADEVVCSSDYPEFRKLVSGSDPRSVSYEFVTRNYCKNMNLVGWIPNDGMYPTQEAGNGWTASPKVRLFPNDPAICFEYPVHELVEPSLKRKGLPVKPCPIPIHHYGKLVEEKTAAKKMAYYQLGKKKITEFEGHASAIRELGIQAGIVGHHQEAIDLWERFVAMHPNDSVGYIYMGASYTQLGRFEAAAEVSQKALLLDPQSVEARYNYGISQFYLGNGTLSVEAFEQILQRHPNYLPAAFMLGAAHSCNGLREEGVQRLGQLKKTAIAPELSSRCLDLTRGLVMRRMLDSAILLLESAIESGVLSADALSLLDNIRQVKKTASET